MQLFKWSGCWSSTFRKSDSTCLDFNVLPAAVMLVRETTKAVVALASCGWDRCTKGILGETILMVSSADHTHPDNVHPLTDVAIM